ncbi:MAG: helix-turn-helix domain-containing protein [Oscillospiraceae bacterium]|jgi:AraC-like DNA-binding protein|nr:helix-turn-helix domain-containing protein [Oscillospiraceae bacterium]MCI9394630.1 helix-turn-helix domain-containing protein [Oscillospiraceae bacterium]MCI9581227.1 helix-turn-helix domain-containing protein [Oscillospiraceae bacterium]
MNVLFDEDQLRRLIANLKTLTGLPANILDPEGRDINLFRGHPPFCRMINDLPEGHRRCVACDRCKIQRYTAEKGFQLYRCHVGICEAIMPLYDKKRPLAYLAVGCYLDDSPLEEQWARTRTLLDWWPDGADALKDAFFQFRQYSKEEIQAYTETLEALSAYIQLKGMILTTEQTDLQRLEAYLDQHYMEKLSLESISRDLHIGRTKLCSLAKELSGGRTLSYLIAQRRISAAKLLLLQSSMPVSAVAETVGISDYNYFSKVFRSVTGITPSAFRKHTGRSYELS